MDTERALVLLSNIVRDYGLSYYYSPQLRKDADDAIDLVKRQLKELRTVLTMTAKHERELLGIVCREPDPETGLISWHDGGIPEIINTSEVSNNWLVKYDKFDILMGAEASGDGFIEGIYRSRQRAIDDWNLAMEYGHIEDIENKEA